MGNKPQNPAASYQTLGDIFLDFGSIQNPVNYRRELNIENAIASVSYSSNNVTYRREFFSSAVDQALVTSLTATKNGSITFTLHLSRQGNKATIIASGNEIDLNEHTGDGTGVKIFTRLKLITDGGTLRSGGDSIRVEKANSATIFLTAATDYFGADPVKLTKTQTDSVISHQYNKIKQDHINDYQSFFKRVDLDLGSGDGGYFATDARITAMQKRICRYRSD